MYAMRWILFILCFCSFFYVGFYGVAANHDYMGFVFMAPTGMFGVYWLIKALSN